MDSPTPGGKRKVQPPKDVAEKRQRVGQGGQKPTATLYQPLSEDKREIRLLKLPATARESAEAPLSLISVPLDDIEVEYTALSYTWRDRLHWQDSKDSLVINGVTVPCGRNLANAMRAINMMRKSTEAYVWVDQLCINQKDPDEKAWQIKLMSIIYLRASKTFVWLGVVHRQPFADAINALGSWTRDEPLDNTKLLSSSILACLRHILSLPWWGRRWVIQEVFLSQNPIVYVGVSQGRSRLSSSTGSLVSVHMDKFAELAVWNSRYLSKNPNKAGGAIAKLFSDCPFHDLLQMWTSVRAGLSVHRDLFAWLKLSVNFNQTLTRDIVYALLPLSSARDQHFVKPDYKSADAAVFQRVFAYLMQHSGGLGTLRLFTISSRPRPDFQLPSWCASLWPAGQRNDRTKLQPRVRFKEPVGIDGSNGITAHKQKQARFIAADGRDTKSNIKNGMLASFNIPKEGPLLLSTPATTLDEIAIVGQTNFTSESLSETALQEAVELCDRRLSKFKPSKYGDSANEKRMALCMTLLGGSCLNKDERFKKQLLRRFYTWMRWSVESLCEEPEQRPTRPSPEISLSRKQEGTSTGNSATTATTSTTPDTLSQIRQDIREWLAQRKTERREKRKCFDKRWSSDTIYTSESETYLDMEPELAPTPPLEDKPPPLNSSGLGRPRIASKNAAVATDAFFKQALVWCCNRSLVITEGGFVGLAPLEVEMGDVVVQFPGSGVPLVLKNRTDEAKEVYEIVGEAFIYGLVGGKEGREREYVIS